VKKSNFKELKDKWYKKLAKTGFRDIEDANEDRLKEWHASWFRKYYDKEKDEYYTLAIDFATNYKFKNALEQFIWYKHSEGHSVRQISDILKTEKKFDLKKTVISDRIQKYAHIMLKGDK